jgi:hypothetical protein
MGITGKVIRFVMEIQAKNASLDELRAKLEAGAETTAARLAQGVDTLENRAQAAHLVGIERWGAHRLQAALQGMPDSGEYDPYRPSPDVTMPALVAEFRRARAETAALAEALRPAQDKIVLHNDLGEMSVKGWLVYLRTHAEMESKKIEKGSGAVRLAGR